MNWNTIYITGRSDFREEVRRKLEHSDVNFMPGYVDNSVSRFMHDLYWLDEKVDLRMFKEAIGSKLIWKYRLNFYMNLEEFIQARNKKENSLALTKEDLDLIAAMQSAA
jgi:hypothetical protein